MTKTLDRKAFKYLILTASTFMQVLKIDPTLLEINSDSNSLIIHMPEDLEFNFLKIYYNVKTKLKILARLYNLMLETHIISEKQFEEMLFRLEYSGILKTEKVAFKQIKGNREIGKEILEKLNSYEPLLEESCRIDFLSLVIKYDLANKRWSIRAELLPGSTTWAIFPPIMYYIKLYPEECMRIINIFNYISKILKII